MKRISLLLAILTVCSELLAQDSALEGRICGVPELPIMSSLSMGVGHGAVRDTYLTPLLYEGTSFGVHFERSRQPFLRGQLHEKEHWLDGSFLLGERGNGGSSCYAGRLQYSYAHRFRLRLFSLFGQWCGLRFGPYAGADLGFNYNLKMAASNNPATARCTAHAGLSAKLSTSYRFFSQWAGLSLQVQTPLLGAALVPEYGASYYETFYLNHTDRDIHFTSLHNRQDLDVRLTTALPVAVFPRYESYANSLRLGVAYHIETMDVNHIVTRYNSLELVVGWWWAHTPYRTSR